MSDQFKPFGRGLGRGRRAPDSPTGPGPSTRSFTTKPKLLLGSAVANASTDVKSDPPKRASNMRYAVDASLFDGLFSIDSKPSILVASTLTRGLGIEASDKSKITIIEPNTADDNTDYVRDILADEKRKAVREQEVSGSMLDVSQSVPVPESEPMDLDGVSTTLPEVANMMDVGPQTINDHYFDEQPFDGLMTSRGKPDLPIKKLQKKILQHVDLHRVVIIEGSTGCGKTTQVPQYLLDHSFENRMPCSIIVTQPRRIAAISVCKRVCEERNWEVGTLVGYQVGMDKSISNEDTRLVYCTTGILLQKLISQKSLDNYTHIIIDEVHERGEETDILLMLVRKLMWMKASAVKLILMSATFETSRLVEYFSIPIKDNRVVEPHVLKIDERVGNLSIYYLDEIKLRSGKKVPVPLLDKDEPVIVAENLETVYNLIEEFDKIDSMSDIRASEKGAVLIFMPGFPEIKELIALLRAPERAGRLSDFWDCIPLHSGITIEDQSKVFISSRPNRRKVIVATNIAESSITVPDIRYVIDFCLTKSLICDQETKYPTLQMEWCAKSSCTQRAGRAGRVADGRVYRLVSKHFYESQLQDYAIPELVRSPLELAVLRVKRVDIDSPKKLLALCVDPPNLKDIKRAVLSLKQAGALTIKVNGIYDEEDGDMTALGRIMSCLPIDIRLSKFIVLGYAMDCMDECIVIAACMSIQNVFYRGLWKEIEAYKSKLAWADRSFSDLLAYLNAYRKYRETLDVGFVRDARKLQDWCKNSSIDNRRIRDADNLIMDLRKRVEGAGLIIHERPNFHRDKMLDELMLKIAICAAFYPNYLISSSLNVADITRMLNNKDPFTTVQLTNLPSNQGVLYVNQLKTLFQVASDQIDFDFEETKGLLTFSGDNNPLRNVQMQQFYMGEKVEENRDLDLLPKDSKVKVSVLVALKMRQLNMPLRVKLFNKDEARRRMEVYERRRDSKLAKTKLLRSNRFTVPAINAKAIRQVKLPPVEVQAFPITVTKVLTCCYFWAQYDTDETSQWLKDIEDIISDQQKTAKMEIVTDGEVGKHIVCYAAPTQRFYRAQIESMESDKSPRVFLIDHGISTIIENKQHMFEMNHPALYQIPALAFKCKLSEIKAASWRLDGMYDEKAGQYFINEVQTETDREGMTLTARVFSVVEDVVRIELIRSDGMSMNKALIDQGYAEKCDESINSMQDNEFRRCFQESSRSFRSMESHSYSFEVIPGIDDEQFGGAMFSKDEARLRGPFSPIEKIFTGMTQQTNLNKVHISGESVNSIALDSEPWSSHSKLCVAGSLYLSSASGRILARDTTIMPTVIGFPSLMALLFAPACQLHKDTQNIRYAGATFGLGFDPTTKRSYDPDNDMRVAFDAYINQHDLRQINLIRFHISDILNGCESTGIALSRKQMSIRKGIFDLLKKKRISFVNEPQMSFDWEPREDTREMEFELPDDGVPILHCIRPLEFNDDVFKTAINKNKEKLKQLAHDYNEYQRISTEDQISGQHEEDGQRIKLNFSVKDCLICETAKFYNPNELVLHLNTKEHKGRADEYEDYFANDESIQ